MIISDQFRKIIIRYKWIGHNMNVLRQTACLVVNPITVNNFADLFNCTPVGWASVKLTWAWWSVFGRAHRGSTVWLLLLQCQVLLLSTLLVLSQWWILYDRCFDSLMSRGPSRGPNVYVYMNLGWGCCNIKPGSSPPGIYYWQFLGDASAVVYSNCQCSSAFCCLWLTVQLI